MTAAQVDVVARTLSVIGVLMAAASLVLNRRDARWARRSKAVSAVRDPLKELRQALSETTPGPERVALRLGSTRNRAAVEAIEESAASVADRRLRKLLAKLVITATNARGADATQIGAYYGTKQGADVAALSAAQVSSADLVGRALKRVDQITRKSPK